MSISWSSTGVASIVSASSRFCRFCYLAGWILQIRWGLQLGSGIWILQLHRGFLIGGQHTGSTPPKLKAQRRPGLAHISVLTETLRV